MGRFAREDAPITKVVLVKTSICWKKTGRFQTVRGDRKVSFKNCVQFEVSNPSFGSWSLEPKRAAAPATGTDMAFPRVLASTRPVNSGNMETLATHVSLAR